MAQSAVDPTVKTFGIFINSNQSLNKSSQKSYVQIPFNGNLSDHDPNKEMQVALTSFRFTNTLYNVTEENCLINILIYWAAKRGFAQRQLQEIKVKIPVGFYSVSQLADYLSLPDIMGKEVVQKRFLYASGESFNNIFAGFGANPADPSDPVITRAAALNASGTKLLFQTPDLAHMIQYGTDLDTVPANLNTFEFSYVYEGVYLECDSPEDSLLAPLLTQLGYITPTTPPSKIPLSSADNPKFGYGFQFEARVVAGATPTTSTVYYSPIGINETVAQTVLDTPINFHGVIYEPASVVLTMAYQLQAGKVMEIQNGEYINGNNISVPSPYVVGYNDCIFRGTFTNGSNEFTIVGTPVSGTLTVGMSIGVDYDRTTLIPKSIGLAAYFNFAVGTESPGVENTNAYYIIEVLSETLYRMNQPFNSPSFTSGVGIMLGSSYVLTTPQEASTTGLYENMLASPNSVTESAATLTPLNVSNMSGVDEIHIHCSELRTENLASTEYQPLSPSDVIAVIPIEAEFGHAQSYLPPNPLTSYLNNTNISVLTVELKDPRGRLLDFNGVDWSMTLFCTESDVATPDTLAKGGAFNTPFQDQLAALEGTAQAEEKKRRIIFHDSKKNKYGGYSNRY
jgi:hypothetical protein